MNGPRASTFSWRLAACAGLFLFSCPKPAATAPGSYVLRAPEAGVSVSLVGWELHKTALRGIPLMGKEPALTPTSDPAAYEVAQRWATSTLARHPQGALFLLQRATDVTAKCSEAFMAARTPVAPAAPRSINGISGDWVVTTAQLPGYEFKGKLKSQHFFFRSGGRCYQVELTAAEPAYAQVAPLMDAVLDSLHTLDGGTL